LGFCFSNLSGTLKPFGQGSHCEFFSLLFTECIRTCVCIYRAPATTDDDGDREDDSGALTKPLCIRSTKREKSKKRACYPLCLPHRADDRSHCSPSSRRPIGSLITILLSLAPAEDEGVRPDGRESVKHRPEKRGEENQAGG
ncbi:hypothetical protein ALC57_11190, partial [Trachymyrmex cornetzi]